MALAEEWGKRIKSANTRDSQVAASLFRSDGILTPGAFLKSRQDAHELVWRLWDDSRRAILRVFANGGIDVLGEEPSAGIARTFIRVRPEMKEGGVDVGKFFHREKGKFGPAFVSLHYNPAGELVEGGIVVRNGQTFRPIEKMEIPRDFAQMDRREIVADMDGGGKFTLVKPKDHSIETGWEAQFKAEMALGHHKKKSVDFPWEFPLEATPSRLIKLINGAVREVWDSKYNPI